MPFEQQAVSLSAEHQKLQQLRKGHVYQSSNEKQKMPNHYLPATLKPMPSTLVDNPVREKNLAIR